ncbi:unnamed protein product [Rotaria sp. Silwood2]|nr:unnamed protein product [Rotaria sp. Silwood2]CAF2716524.1 unnamed protein product [Rotaria sp. Silwood2]CAF3126012.1 unnamed protein product [Rotaria sp. Silwood2]CAF3984920.1 unnamed protein product [Rotaria sp. Silwood2]CAF4057550.1 unnamed protein product [Rotaria sp. Silwood2]
MRSSIVFMLFLALFIIVFMKSSNARQIPIDDDDDFQISNAKARAFLDFADDYMKRVNAGTLRLSDIKSFDGNFEYESSTSSSKGDCEYNEEYYMNGQTFMDNGNYCGCAYQQVTCAAMLCRTTVPQ